MKDCIPEDLRPILADLNSEIVWLHGRWKIYRQLYAHSPERVELLNASAGTFFYVLQWLLLDDVALSVARLTDPVGSGERQNVVLGQLPMIPSIVAESTLYTDITRQLNQIDQMAESMRLIRNKRIAHRDIRYALKVEGASLPGISCESVEAILAAIRQVMNTINRHFCQSETAYESFMMVTDGDALVGVLKRGLAFDQAEIDQIVPWDYLDQSQFGRA